MTDWLSRPIRVFIFIINDLCILEGIFDQVDVLFKLGVALNDTAVLGADDAIDGALDARVVLLGKDQRQSSLLFV